VRVLIERIAPDAAILRHYPTPHPGYRVGTIDVDLPENTPDAEIREKIRGHVIREVGARRERPIQIEFERQAPVPDLRRVRYKVGFVNWTVRATA